MFIDLNRQGRFNMLLSFFPLHHLSKKRDLIFNMEKGSEGCLIITAASPHESFAGKFIAIDYCALKMVSCI
jgi:hypothetical protein